MVRLKIYKTNCFSHGYKALLICLLLLKSHLLVAQNLVPNGDFETYNACPFSSDLAYSPTYTNFPVLAAWVNPMGLTTSDYFNICATPFTVGVPVNMFGYQEAHSGNGYIGMYSYEGNSSMSLYNYREYAECKLNSPLQAGHQYYVSFYVSYSGDDAALSYDCIAVEKMGAYLSDTEVYDSSHMFLTYMPQIVNTSGYLTDTANWIKIGGIYTAQGGEQWLTLGHFYDTTMPLDYTVTVQGDTTIDFMIGYMYLDDVCVMDMGNVITSNRDTTICQSSFPAILNDATPDCTYQWSTGDTSAGISIDTPGTYWVRKWANCVYFADTIKVTARGSSFINTNDTSICRSALPVLLHGSNGIRYMWNTGDTTAGLLTNTWGTYWVSIYDSICNHIIDTIQLDSIPPQQLYIGNDTSFCDSGTLSANNVYSQYLWSTGASTADITVNQSGNYWLRATDSCGNVVSDTISILIKHIVPPIVSDTTVCRHVTDVILQVTGDSLKWYSSFQSSTGNMEQPAINTDTARIDTLYVTASNSCGESAKQTIRVYVEDKPYVTLQNDTTLCSGFILELKPVSDGVSYMWSTGDTGCCINVSQTGEYLLTVTNLCGSNMDSVHTDFQDCDACAHVPDAFTPNNDGLNDKFHVLSNCPLKSYQLMIFNRWGQMVYISNNIKQGWDGTYNNQPAEMGVYFYLLEIEAESPKDAKEIRKGEITLIR